MTTPRWAQRNAAIPVPQHREGVVEERLDDEVILVEAVGGQIHRLNETATTVWDGCDGWSTTIDIAERLTRLYAVDFDQALDYVEQLVAWLVQSNMLDLGGST
jgi:hypothetical protein